MHLKIERFPKQTVHEALNTKAFIPLRVSAIRPLCKIVNCLLLIWLLPLACLTTYLVRSNRTRWPRQVSFVLLTYLGRDWMRSKRPQSERQIIAFLNFFLSLKIRNNVYQFRCYLYFKRNELKSPVNDV